MKKSSKHKLGRTCSKRRKKLGTGVEDQWGFFPGGENVVAGYMHYKAPRWTEEYQALAVHQIAKRIMDDMTELLARAMAPFYSQNSPFAYSARLRAVIHESVAESLCPGLMARIRSSDETEQKMAMNDYDRHLDSLLVEEPKNAGNSVAFITKWAALRLENLFLKQPELMREIAAKFDLWPVNLGLETRRKDGSAKQTLTRATFARNYLTELGLNQASRLRTGRAGGVELTSPITLAAESLYEQLLLLKGTNPGAFIQNTQWARRLGALAVPMTRRTATQWWNVAKVFLYERWEKARHEFAPLEKHLQIGLDGTKYPYESRIKSRVIDDALKKAFQALAQPDL